MTKAHRSRDSVVQFKGELSPKMSSSHIMFYEPTVAQTRHCDEDHVCGIWLKRQSAPIFIHLKARPLWKWHHSCLGLSTCSRAHQQCCGFCPNICPDVNIFFSRCSESFTSPWFWWSSASKEWTNWMLEAILMWRSSKMRTKFPCAVSGMFVPPWLGCINSITKYYNDPNVWPINSELG